MLHDHEDFLDVQRRKLEDAFFQQRDKALIENLKKMGGKDIIVVVGGVIPPADYDFLYAKGVKAIFGPGTAVTKSADKVLQLLEEQYL